MQAAQQNHSQQAALAPGTESVQSKVQADSTLAEPNNSTVSQPGVNGNAHAVAALDDSTIQQHSKILNARLQSQPAQKRFESFSDSDVDAEQTMTLPTDFKATLVDATGPIPGLEGV